MWETLECRRMMSVTLATTSTLPYMESTTVDGGTTSDSSQVRRSTSLTSSFEKKDNVTISSVTSQVG
jgi:hypothetical protein